MNLYFISGLGADKRVFQKLILPEVFNIHYIEWLPVSEDETIESYCKRLSGQINQEQPYSLVGLSFGGVISIEMSKFLLPEQTVIISSFCTRKEVPRLYAFLKWTRLYRLLPIRLLLKPNNLVFRLFGAYNPAMKNLLKNILEDTDPKFFAWAFRQLFRWDNDWKPENMVRIHGTADKILPYQENMDAITVEGGEHLMVYSKWEMVSEILKENLRTKPA
jgi:hypothetical protein